MTWNEFVLEYVVPENQQFEVKDKRGFCAFNGSAAIDVVAELYQKLKPLPCWRTFLLTDLIINVDESALK